MAAGKALSPKELVGHSRLFHQLHQQPQARLGEKEQDYVSEQEERGSSWTHHSLCPSSVSAFPAMAG